MKQVSHIWDADQRKFIQRRSEFVERSRVVLIAFFFLSSVVAIFMAFKFYWKRPASGSE
jgi:hypothetical protein